VLIDFNALAVFVAYLIAIAVIAYFGAKRVKTLADFVAASGRLGFWTYVLLMIGTVFSGMTMVGVAGLSFQTGWANLWERVIGPPFAIAFCTVFIGYKMHALREKHQIWTIQDYFALRYEDPKYIRAIAGAISAVTCFVYLIGQYTAIGIVSEVVLGIPYFWGSLIALALVVGYVLTGGMFSTAWTTFLQSILMILGVYATVPWIVGWVGGWEKLNELLSQVPLLQEATRSVSKTYLWGPLLDQPFAPANVPLAGLAYNITLFGLCVPLGLMVAPHIVNNVLCYRDVKFTRWGPLMMYLLGVSVILLTSIAGMAARAAWAQGNMELPKLAITGATWSDFAYPTIAKAALPYGLSLVLLPTVLAAVMSTTDRLMLTAASNVAYDIVKRVLRPSISDRAVIWIGRIVVVAVGVGSWLIALGPQDLLAWFIWAALSIMVDCFFWPIIGGLYWKRMNKHAARWSMIAGFMVTLVSFAVWGKTIKIGDVPVYSVLPGFVTSTAVTLILAFATKPHSEKVLRETFTGTFLRAEK
jgi:SSS family solute:Na+ symporter